MKTYEEFVVLSCDKLFVPEVRGGDGKKLAACAAENPCETCAEAQYNKLCRYTHTCAALQYHTLAKLPTMYEDFFHAV